MSLQRRLPRFSLCSLPPHQSLLVIEAQVRSPGFPSGLVVENIILRQRAAVHVADGALGGSGSAILLAGGNGVDHRLRRRLRRHPAATSGAVRLAVEVVQVLGDAEACSVQQELGQEVARCR